MVVVVAEGFVGKERVCGIMERIEIDVDLCKVRQNLLFPYVCTLYMS